MATSSIEKEWDKERIALVCLSIAASIIVIGVLNALGNTPLISMGKDYAGNPIPNIDWGRLLVDYTYIKTPEGNLISQPNWKAAQNFMWIAFFIGLGEVFYRNQRGKADLAETEKDYLPQDETTLLNAQDLLSIYKRARRADARLTFPKLLRQLYMQYRRSGNADQLNTILSSSLDLSLHALDLKYTLIRYGTWVIPSLGFLGTVIGIADALAFVGGGSVDPEKLLGEASSRLAVAFYTTWLALIMSSILVLLMNLVQAKEERALNRAGTHCLENFINRILPPSHQ